MRDTPLVFFSILQGRNRLMTMTTNSSVGLAPIFFWADRRSRSYLVPWLEYDRRNSLMMSVDR